MMQENSPGNCLHENSSANKINMLCDIESIDMTENWNIDNTSLCENISQQKIYDDPCELELIDDESSRFQFRLIRSNSWFCCPKLRTENNHLPSANVRNSFYENSQHNYALITEPPQTQFQIVN
jgi:hypothetical protein